MTIGKLLATIIYKKEKKKKKTILPNQVLKFIKTC